MMQTLGFIGISPAVPAYRTGGLSLRICFEERIQSEPVMADATISLLPKSRILFFRYTDNIGILYTDLHWTICTRRD